MSWINRKSVLTTVAGAILIMALTAGWGSVKAEIQAYREMKAGYARQADIEDLKQAVQQLTIAVLTTTGQARIQQDGAEIGMKINTTCQAARLIGQKRARVTNLSHPDSPASTIAITGTFTNPDTHYMAILTAAAGIRLEAESGSTIDVQIEPANQTPSP